MLACYVMLPQVEESTNHIAHSQSFYMRLRTENMEAFRYKSEASVSASIVLIHTRLEDSTASDF